MIKKQMICVLILLFSLGWVSAQAGDDPVQKAYSHYLDGMKSAIEDYISCLPLYGSNWSGSETARLLNGLDDIEKETEVLVCELAYNSRMIQLQIEVQLLLAGIDRLNLNTLNHKLNKARQRRSWPR